jgi:hypothetical protein
MRSQLLALEYEELLGVPTRLRYPAFKHIMWTLALGYAKALRQAAGEVLPLGRLLLICQITEQSQHTCSKTPTNPSSFSHAGLQKLQKQRMTSSKDNAGAGGGPTTTAVTLSQTMVSSYTCRPHALSRSHQLLVGCLEVSSFNLC